MKVHLVAETVPLGTTFCQKVPEEPKNKDQNLKLDSTVLLFWCVLTHEAAPGQVQLVAS